MNVRIAKDEVSLLFPNNMSYSAPAENAEREASQAREAAFGRSLGALVRGFGRGLAWIAELPRRHAVLTELEMMSDRELADIGLGRGELNKVFHPDFVSARGKARASSGPSRIATGA